MSDTEPIGIRGPGRLDPRWQHIEPLVADMATALEHGGPASAEAAARRVEEATHVVDVDAAGLDIRARALSNLATIAEANGDPAEAIALATQAIELCLRVEPELGLRRRTVDVRIGALINRAQTFALVGQDADGLADLDAAAAAFDDETPALLAFGVHNTRANAYRSLERLEEAEAEFRTALDIALTREPRLASYAYSGLAAILHQTGDRAGGREHMRLARELQATDPASAARTDESLARMALEQGDLEEAAELFAAAELGYAAGGDPRRLAGCRFGRAALDLARGRLLPARKVARQALTDFEVQGDVAAQIETNLLLGDIHVRGLRFGDADAYFLRARELCAAQGTMHELARIDVRRAGVAHAAAGVAIRPSEKLRRLEGALNLALPAALATDAMRQRFTPGPVRERWVVGVASVALTIALDIITSLQHTRLAVELMEFASASATVDAGATTDRMTSLPVLAQAHSPFDAGFALAAAGIPTAGTVDTSPAVPPRVRAFTDGSTAFHVWIAEAERRYELTIRSRDVIDAW